jgi:hypothetical protein
MNVWSINKAKFLREVLSDRQFKIILEEAKPI